MIRTRRPTQAKSTDRMLRSILPQHFKIVEDKSSNGYKFMNLLYGAEADEARDRLQEVYNNSYLETMDFSEDGALYEVYISGIPYGGYLNASGDVPIKIVNRTNEPNIEEFYSGDPTRLIVRPVVDISGIIPAGAL